MDLGTSSEGKPFLAIWALHSVTEPSFKSYVLSLSWFFLLAHDCLSLIPAFAVQWAAGIHSSFFKFLLKLFRLF